MAYLYHINNGFDEWRQSSCLSALAIGVNYFLRLHLQSGSARLRLLQVRESLSNSAFAEGSVRKSFFMGLLALA